ncbi:ABC-ATPase domain-containing protein [Streptomonospora nanhaiensis]|uniref:Putative ABC-class ATPase n=1 Tax=Streptomonospora nanhaiensis TaxID=1323731 RepID=A0A853BTX8_9ACTN|nr:ABC-ATPase domain-containing protein [Streptomonospora nanhaiensis]MBV2363719.1 ABC-ATPase domain-containing protein [Streptomonospora nanhaiensis]MBX9391236.1 ABC-ATPase domain-containing protein [Streptomonospora nanhaiensis]NYI98768.1 putative ABC-class ATPase [Streptomonospora nanhaiensis]
MPGRYGGQERRHGGGRPERRGGHGGPPHAGRRPEPEIRGRRDDARLAEELRRMDGASYGRYKSLTGDWSFPDFTLTVERVQSDPFAPPSRVAVRVPAEVAELPDHAWRDPVRRRATADYLVRRAHRELKGARLRIDAGGQQVIARASGRIRDGAVELRLGIELPGHGRRIDARTAERELCERLPDLVDALRWPALDTAEATAFADSVEDTVALRDLLPGLGLVAFVADGAVLPRRSGVSDSPMEGAAVPFTAPESMRVAVDLPHAGRVTGLGIPEGITLIVGGGFHGKSTLLHALERGVYDHVPGDGRELVVTRPDAVKIRAEEGRRVERTDVSAFVRNLPTGADTADFSTDNASGSTSQAANIAEALEAGARTLLVDEDTTATNLMIRDARMQRLVHGDREPLTPFVDLVRPLHRGHGVSTVLVMGGSGDYFDVADRVVMLDGYRPYDVTERAKELAAERADADFAMPAARVVDPRSVDATARGRARVKRRDMDVLTFGEDEIDVRGLTQLVDPGQVIGVGLALRLLAEDGLLDGERTLAQALDALEERLGADGAAALGRGYAGDYALPRRHEVAAALNRLRSLRVLRST